MSPPRRSKTQRQSRTARIPRVGKRQGRRFWRNGLLLIAGLAILALVGLVWPFWKLSSQFDSAPLRRPSRLFESPPTLEVGAVLTAEEWISELSRRGYRPSASIALLTSTGTSTGTSIGPRAEREPEVGRYRRHGQTMIVHLRSFATPLGLSRPAVVEAEFGSKTVRRLTVAGQSVSQVWLDPRLLASYYGDDLVDRWPERVDRLPRHVLLAVLAAEDAAFFNHPGLSASGMLRALWVNLEGGEVIQGGSTLTQQLVKNLYLNQERTLGRKAREALLALFLEVRYEKRQILEAYLNEIFFGRIGPVNVVGLGAAARIYFGVPAAELTLADAALLAGVIRSPSRLSPVFHPEAALARRAEVLARMLELGWIEDGAHRHAGESPLSVIEPDLNLYRARYAADAAASEAKRRFGSSDLAGGGYFLVSTLSARDQEAAEEATRASLDEIGARLSAEKAGSLQAAVVSAEPATGRVLAWVGGRDYAASQYDRLRFARRQPGSAFKPVVLAAAFSERKAVPSSRLVDEPIEVLQNGQSWSPQNDDREYHGVVTVRETIERSLNVPTVRLALEVGLPAVVSWAQQLGIESPLRNVPSLALGAFEVTPLELLGVYNTIAAGGSSAELHLLEAVVDRDGVLVGGAPIESPKRVLEPSVAFMITSILEGVVERGTARRLRAFGLFDRLAAKTGTSSGGRDAWLVGYSADRATLVWVGFDQGSGSGLSGSRSALPLWARYMKQSRPAEGYRIVATPRDIATVTIDPETSELALDACPQAVTEIFPADLQPREFCHEHGERGSRSRRWRRGRRRF